MSSNNNCKEDHSSIRRHQHSLALLLLHYDVFTLLPHPMLLLSHPAAALSYTQYKVRRAAALNGTMMIEYTAAAELLNSTSADFRISTEAFRLTFFYFFFCDCWTAGLFPSNRVNSSNVVNLIISSQDCYLLWYRRTLVYTSFWCVGCIIGCRTCNIQWWLSWKLWAYRHGQWRYQARGSGTNQGQTVAFKNRFVLKAYPSRTDLEKVLKQHDSSLDLSGFYVRVYIGKKDNKRVYSVACIDGSAALRPAASHFCQ